MSATVSQTEANVTLALWNLLTALLGVEVVLGQENRVGVPSAADFVVMTVMDRTRLGTNIDRYADPAKQLLQKVQIDVQLDVFGPRSADLAQVVTTVARDSWAAEFFKAQSVEAAILYAGEPHQMPWTTGENQYENRWTLTVALQANVVVSLPQGFADQLTITPTGVP